MNFKEKNDVILRNHSPLLFEYINIPEDHELTQAELDEALENYWKDHARVIPAKSPPYLIFNSSEKLNWNYEEFYINKDIWDKLSNIFKKYEFQSTKRLYNLTLEVRGLMEFAWKCKEIYVPMDRREFWNLKPPYELIGPRLQGTKAYD